MKHLKQDLIKICLGIYDDFWQDPIFLETTRLRNQLDNNIDTLNHLTNGNIPGILQRYRKLQHEQPCYDFFLNLSRDDAQKYLGDLDYQKLQKTIVDLNYKKEICNVIPLSRGIRALLVDVNYRIATHGKPVSPFGLDPDHHGYSGSRTKKSSAPSEYQ